MNPEAGPIVDHVSTWPPHWLIVLAVVLIIACLWRLGTKMGNVAASVVALIHYQESERIRVDRELGKLSGQQQLSSPPPRRRT